MLHRRGRRRIPRACVLAGLGAARVRRSGPTPVGVSERGSGLTSPKRRHSGGTVPDSHRCSTAIEAHCSTGWFDGLMDVLILGGTTKARQLATRLIDEGVDLCSSLAGRTKSPRPVPGPTRVGGFGGVDGLKEFLTDNEVKVMVDASHPFAAAMHGHAAQACRDLNLPLARLAPPSWRTQPEAATWHWVDDHDGATQVLTDLPDVILLTVGRQPVSHYLRLGPRRVIVRCVDAPEEELPAGWTVLRERGPFTLDREREIFSQGVATLVSKDSGGTGLDPKLRLAAETDVQVVMVSRGPAPGWGDELSTVDDAVQWTGNHIATVIEQ